MNGILANVPGQYVAQGDANLPRAESAQDREYGVTIEAGHAGTVQVFYGRQKVSRGKHSHWFWRAVRAERVPAFEIRTLIGE